MTLPTPPTAKGVIFDMDGVLCKSEPFVRKACIQTFKELYNVDVQPGEFLPFTGMGESYFLGGVADAHGLAIDLEKAKARTYEIYLDLIAGRLQPSPGSHEFVAWCRQLGSNSPSPPVPTASSSTATSARSAWVGMRSTPSSPARTSKTKARPDAFVISADKLGLDPSVCLVIEDAVAGVRAAKTAGCRCLALTTSFGEGDLLQAGATGLAQSRIRARRRAGVVACSP